MYNNNKDNNKSSFPNQGNYPKNPILDQGKGNAQSNKNELPKQILPKGDIPKSPYCSGYKK